MKKQLIKNNSPCPFTGNFRHNALLMMPPHKNEMLLGYRRVSPG